MSHLRKKRSENQHQKSKKDRLLEVGEELFLSQGYDETKVSHIVKRVGVAQGTFYYYFQSKDALLLDIITNKFRVISHQLMEIIDYYQDFATVVEHLVISCFDPCKERLEAEYLSHFLSADYHSILDNRWHNMLEPVLERLFQSSESIQYMGLKYPQEIMYMLMSGINISLTKIFYETTMPQERIINQLAAIEEMIQNALKLKPGSLNIVKAYRNIEDTSR